MILESIKLENYRQYINEKINFTQPYKDKNFTIIQGANGCGKTNLLNAITWCLYGEEKHLEEKKRGLPLISMPTVQKMESGDVKEVYVEIVMFDEDSNQIIFKRKLQFRKSEDGKIRTIPNSLSTSPDGSTFEMIRQIKQEMVFVQTPTYILNRLIPESLEEYFFFDGERLNDYFKEKSDKIREEVFKISQMDLLETTIKHLDTKKNDFLKESGKLSSKAESIKETLEILVPSLNRYKDELKIRENEKELAEIKENEYREKLKNCNVEYISKRQNERDSIERDLEKIGIDIEEVNVKKLDYLIRIAPQLFLFNPVSQSIELISEREDAGDIPADYKRHFIQKLLDKGSCICGTDISNDDSFRKNVIAYIDRCDQISDISEEIAKLNVNLKSLYSTAKNFTTLEFNQTIRKLEGQKNEKIEKLREISEEIASYGDYKDAIFWEQKYKEYLNSKNDLLREIGKIEANLDGAKKEIDKWEKDLDNELAKEEKYKEIRKILVFCDISLEEIRKIQTEIMDEFRKELENKTEEQFFELIWKKENYKSVKISDNYELSVIHQSGLEGINTLSAGERQVLALSFMAALNSVSGFDAPIIIDTPLGRISKEPKINIAKNLPNYLKGKQVILLVTEEEYTPEVRDKLIERVGNEYRIVFEEKKEGAISRVIPYAK